MKTMKTYTRTYSELMKLKTFEERFEYLKLDGRVGEATFGRDRLLNQVLYSSAKWKRFRRDIIIRDGGCDLGVEGYELEWYANVHHINPITVEDVLNEDPAVYDPENVITTSDNTHKAIHYSNENILVTAPVERTPNDTCPWKQNRRRD